jgi:predicted DNA-binding ribbon-helix-helix protein
MTVNRTVKNSTIAKRSVVIDGHKTSVSLEQPFWQAVRDIGHARAMTVSALLQEIDRTRGNSNLSSAVRVFVLDFVRGDRQLPPPADRAA